MPTRPPVLRIDAAAQLRGQVEAWVNEGGSWERAAAPLRVLVIEDDVMTGMLLVRILVDMGHLVLGLEQTEQGAVAAAAATGPDLILADENLRIGSGRSAMERILHQGFVPHIWMSGSPIRRTGPQPGIAALQKPFAERDLKLAIAQVMVHCMTGDG